MLDEAKKYVAAFTFKAALSSHHTGADCAGAVLGCVKGDSCQLLPWYLLVVSDCLLSEC